MSVAANLRFAYQKGMRALGFGVASSRSQDDDVVPTITSGTGAPDHTAANGSVYLRTNGAATTTVYTMVSGTWTGLGDGVALSVGDDEAFTIGADSDISIEYDENGTDDLRITNGASDADIVIEDDLIVFFGSDKDIGLEYDEDGTDDLRVTQGVSVPDLVLPDSMLVIFGTDKDTSIGNDGSTGLQVLIADNDADSFEIAQGANVYFHCNTANDLEKVVVSKLFAQGVTATVAAPIDMAGAEHTLVLGTAGAAETKLVGNMIFADANTGSAPENLVLPAAASCTGMILAIKNVGGEQMTVNTSVLTLEAGEGGFVVSDGTAWAGFGVGANT